MINYMQYPMFNYNYPITAGYNQVNPYIKANQAPFVQPQYAGAGFYYPSSYYVTNPLENINFAPSYIKRSGDGWSLTGLEKTPYGDNIYKYILKNGQTVAIMPKKDATTMVKTFVNAGSMNESDDKRGISHFNEHNVFNGSKNLPSGKFFQAVGKLGAETNASTDYAQTDFYIESPIIDNKSLEEIIKLHSDMLVNPTFPDEKVEKEKGPVTSEISMVNDDMTTIAINELIKNLFQIQSNSKNLVAGSLETVNSITRDDVYNHWKKHFTPDNMYTVLVGDIDPNYAIDLISKNFTTPYVENAEALRRKEVLTPIQTSVRKDFISPNDSQTNIFCGFTGPAAYNTKDKIALVGLDLLLFGDNSSRLSKKLDKIYACGNSEIQKVGLNKEDPLALLFEFGAQKGDDNVVIDEFCRTIQNVLNYPPTEDEMQIIKSTLLKSLACQYEMTESITDTIGSSLLNNNFDSISEYKNLIENLKPEDIVNTARKYVDFNKMSVTVVHPKDTTAEEIQANYLKSEYAKTPKTTTKNITFKGKSNITTDNVQELILSDGSTLVLNDANSENCYFNWKLNSKAPVPDNPACAYVLAQILNDGSKYKSREQMSENASKKSVAFDVNVNAFQIEGVASSLYTNAEDAINTLKEAIYAPRITENDFNAAVEKVRTYCSSMKKDASTNLLAKLFGKYFPSPKQILKGLETLTIEDVKKQYDNLIFNSSSSMTISAPLTKHPELKDKLINSSTSTGVKFKEQERNLLKSYVPNKKTTVILDTEERNQAQIYQNYSFEITGNIEDEVKLELLNTILGGTPTSRLFQDLRETQKLAYRVSSQIQSFENSGILTLGILTTTDDKKQNDIKYDNLQKSIDGFNNHANKLMTEFVTDEELESAKMTLKQNIAGEMELPAYAAELISMNVSMPFGIKRIDEYIKTIDKMTKQDIQDAARHVFSNKPVYSILASSDTVENQRNYINKLGNVIEI